MYSMIALDVHFLLIFNLKNRANKKINYNYTQAIKIPQKIHNGQTSEFYITEVLIITILNNKLTMSVTEPTGTERCHRARNNFKQNKINDISSLTTTSIRIDNIVYFIF